MVKRRATGSPEGGPSEKKTHWRQADAKTELTPAAITRLSKAGVDYSKDNEKEKDPRPEEELYEGWVDLGARYLLHEPSFWKVVRNLPRTEDVEISKKFLATIHLEQRYKICPNYTAFHVKFFDRYKKSTTGHKKDSLGITGDIFQRAVEYANEVIGTPQQTVTNTSVEPLPDSPENIAMRQQVFLYHVSRQRLLDALHHTTDQEYKVAKRYFGAAEENLSALQAELSLLGEVEQELRNQLSACTTEDQGKALLDGFLQRYQQSSTDTTRPKLYELPEDNSDDATAYNEDEELVEAEQSLQNEIASDITNMDAVYPIPDESFVYDENMLRAPDTVVVRIRPKAPVVNMPGEAQINSFTTVESLLELDQAVHGGLTAAAEDVPEDRFKVNFNHFVSIIKRPQSVLGAKAGDTIWNNSARRLDLADDNMLHVRKLVVQLFEEGLFSVTDNPILLQLCLDRLWALESVVFGCAPEGSLWLTVMDSLLEDLASLLVGSVNPRLNTSTMARVRDARSGQEVSLALTQDQMQELERADRARRIFAELSRFYRGAVQLAYAGANWKINYNLKNSQTWYDGLTKWSFLCGAETCIEKLDVRTLVDGGDPEERDLDALDPDKMDEPRTKAKGKQKNKSGEHEHDVISRSKFMVAISVHDGRFGFPAQRADISDNRKWAYPCLYDFIAETRWHPHFGPFFHYFAHLYHSSCMPSRGKMGIQLTIEGAAKDFMTD